MTHNKKRNTAFLFEALVKEQVECVLKKKDKRAKLIEKTINKFFSPSTYLYKDLELYLTLSESRNINAELAERLIAHAKQTKSELNDSELWKEQSKLISFINKALGAHIYENFVPNYKHLATINSIFNKKLPVKFRAIMEQRVKNFLTSSEEKESIPDNSIDLLVFQKFVENFNNQYADLLSEQKQLLSKFILYQFGSEIDFKVYMNEECSRITKTINNNLVKLDNSPILKESVTTCLNDLKTVSFKHIDETLVYQIMKYQELANTLRDK